MCRAAILRAIDIPPMPDGYDNNNEASIVNLIKNSVISNPNSPSRTARQFFAAVWSGIIGQRTNGGDDAITILRGDFR
jgi:hypothetical protein